MNNNNSTVTLEQYIQIGTELFGEDRLNWSWICPLCQHIATAQDYKDAGAPEGACGFSCVGRWTENPRGAFDKGPGPCDYTGGGLFQLNPVLIEDHGRYFKFAEPVYIHTPDIKEPTP